jgi:chemotaxis signal transduction protein
MTVAVGTKSWATSTRFAATSAVNEVTPVILPSGRFSLATSPSCTGSPAVVKTMGIVLVEAFATRLAGVLVAAMTETRRLTRSSASAAPRRSGPHR